MKQKNSTFLIVLFGILSFSLFVFSSPEFNGKVSFNSPDETANFFWANNLAAGNKLWYYEPLEGLGNSLLKPRSFGVSESRVIPGSFLGFPILYGWLGFLFGNGIILYLTSLFAGIAVVAFGLLIKRLLGKELGIISAAVLTFLPPWWYYSARGMYHNVLFVSLVIIGVSFLVHLLYKESHKAVQINISNNPPLDKGWQGGSLRKQAITKSLINLFCWSLAGFILGSAIIVRSSEIVWVSILVLIILLSHWRSFRLVKIITFVSSGILALLPLFYYNIQIYGAPISVGYGGAIGQGFSEFLLNLSTLEYRNLFFAPFGVNLHHLQFTVQSFVIEYYWWWFWPTITGVIIILTQLTLKNSRYKASAFFRIISDREIDGKIESKESQRKKWLMYLFTSLIISALLVVYYGSWVITDRIDQQSISLNTSFFRYWLPIYILAIPFIAKLISTIGNLFKNSFVNKSVITILLALFTFISGYRVLAQTDESLFTVRQRLMEASIELSQVEKIVTEDSIIITFPQADKVLFPKYKRLITALVNPEDYRAVKRLVKIEDVYFYTFAPPEFIEKIISPAFRKHGLDLVQEEELSSDRWLWRVIILNQALAIK